MRNETSERDLRTPPERTSESPSEPPSAPHGPENEADASAGTQPIQEINAEEKVRLMAETADAVRATDIVALDLRPLTIITDFFLICTGKSSIQLRAIADRIEERLREVGIRKLRAEGYQEATWILMDYGDVVAHIMAEEQRIYYNLEAFWSSAPRLELDFPPATAPLTAPTHRT